MSTINYDDGAVKTVGTAALTTSVSGHGASGPPLFSGAGGRTQKVVTGQVSFDASYPTGGEDISDIFDMFRGSTVLGIYFDPSVPLTSAGTGKRLKVDYAGKKLLLYDNAVASAEVVNASDQSGAAAIRFCAWGYA